MNMIDNKKNLYRVLIIDDDPAVCQVLADLLQSPNRSIEVRDTSQAALEFLQHNPVDLAFVDLMLPRMTGTKLAERIKGRYPHAHVVICTGQLADAPTAEAHPTNVERVLQKPLNLGEVLQLADSYTTE
jgi:CheY-like chemotaxis protein